MRDPSTHQKDGTAVAAILAAGVGCAVIGFSVPLTEAFPAVKEALNWWAPAGPLTGKTGVGVLAWLLTWATLHWRWRTWEFPYFASIWRWALILIAIGWLGTFPPIFEAFAVH